MEKDQVGILIIESDKIEQNQIAQSFQANPLVSFVEIAEDTDVALLKIIDLNPDLVLMEYPLKGKTGDGIIKFIQSKLPETTIVFISVSKEYAAEAIRHKVYNYLLKPIVKTELGRILEKVQLRKQTNSLLRLNEIIENSKEKALMRFNTSKGFIIINPDEIIFCKADGSYTELHFTNKNIELTYLSLSKMEKILDFYNFMRISRSIIVNKNYIRKVYLTANKLVLSSNGEEYEIKGSRLQIRILRKIYLE